MIVDSSALVAVLRQEDDVDVLVEALVDAEAVSVSAATLVETGVVVDAAKDPVLSRRLDELLTEARVTVVPLTERQAAIARQASRDFGRGSGHPAGLNLGDCFAYALAIDVGEPLLFKSDDFVHTDVQVAVP